MLTHITLILVMFQAKIDLRWVTVGIGGTTRGTEYATVPPAYRT